MHLQEIFTEHILVYIWLWAVCVCVCEAASFNIISARSRALKWACF